jgi:single-strand DNA-binding protein
MDLNEQTVIGTVGQGPTQRGKGENAATVFTVATNSTQGGEKKTIWNNIVTFGNTAKICSQYVVKGSKVYIRGRVSEYKYRKDNEDTDRIRHEIIVEKLILLGGKTKDESAIKNDEPFDSKLPF